MVLHVGHAPLASAGTALNVLKTDNDANETCHVVKIFVLTPRMVYTRFKVNNGIFMLYLIRRDLQV